MKKLKKDLDKMIELVGEDLRNTKQLYKHQRHNSEVDFLIEHKIIYLKAHKSDLTEIRSQLNNL